MRRMEPVLFRLECLAGIVLGMVAVACAPRQPLETQTDQVQHPILGKTKTDIVSCAGPPVGTVETQTGLILRYYREAAMLDESPVFLKGSRPGIHRGCWAHVMLENDRVVGAEFRSAPESLQDVSLCDRMFESCML